MDSHSNKLCVVQKNVSVNGNPYWKDLRWSFLKNSKHSDEDMAIGVRVFQSDSEGKKETATVTIEKITHEVFVF